MTDGNKNPWACIASAGRFRVSDTHPCCTIVVYTYMCLLRVCKQADVANKPEQVLIKNLCVHSACANSVDRLAYFELYLVMNSPTIT